MDVDQSDINKAVNKAGAIIGTFTPGKTQVRPCAAGLPGIKSCMLHYDTAVAHRTSTTSCIPTAELLGAFTCAVERLRLQKRSRS